MQDENLKQKRMHPSSRRIATVNLAISTICLIASMTIAISSINAINALEIRQLAIFCLGIGGFIWQGAANAFDDFIELINVCKPDKKDDSNAG